MSKWLFYMSRQIAGRFRNLTFRARLLLVFISFLLAWVGVGTWQILNQSGIAERAMFASMDASERAIQMIEARELLRAIQRDSSFGIVDSDDLDRLWYQLQNSGYFEDSFNALAGGDFRGAFQRYARELSRVNGPYPDRAPLEIAYQELTRNVNFIVQFNEARVAALDREYRVQQSQGLRVGFGVLLLFFFLSIFLVYEAIAIIARPLTSMEHFLDQVDLEHNIPWSGPTFGSALPEWSRIEKSFERLFQRILGYRNLNIKRLLKEKRRADLIASCISDGIILLNEDEIVYVNPVGEKLLGFLPGGLSQAQTLTSLIRRADSGDISPDTPSARGAKAVLTAISRSMPVEFSVRGENRDHHYLIQATSLSEGEKMSYGDQSEQIRATMLILAQDITLVKESQEAKGHFLATLSHEIKTPVTSLTMATRLLKRSRDQISNPTLQSLIDTSADDVDRLRGLLSDLLSISGFDTLTQKLAIQNVDLGRLIKHSAHSFKSEALERGIELDCIVQLSERRPLLVPGDPTKISWAISNLFTNALRHTPKGGRVEVVAKQHEDWAEVRIRDSGPGIDKRRLGQIFEKFSSFYDIRVARSGGAGVGLSITREIVVAHHGRIWVTSEPGQGAEFCFTLPLVHDGAGRSNNSEAMSKLGQDSSKVGEQKGASGGKTACGG